MKQLLSGINQKVIAVPAVATHSFLFGPVIYLFPFGSLFFLFGVGMQPGCMVVCWWAMKHASNTDLVIKHTGRYVRNSFLPSA